MQYRYGAQSFERNRFDAVKATLLHSRASSPFDACRPADTGNYAGRFMDFASKIRFIARGRPLDTASVPLHSGPAKLVCGSSEPPPIFQPATATADIDKPRPERSVVPPANNFYQGIPNDSGLRSATDHISTAVLGSVLSVTVAIAAGIIIANNTAFKLKVAPSQHAADVRTDKTAMSAAPVAVQPARTMQAPPAPALSMPKREFDRTENPRVARARTTSERKPVIAVRRVPGAKVARQAEKDRSARTVRQTASAPRVRTMQEQPKSVAQAAVPTAAQSRPAPPSLAAQYARCTQQQGLLRRERCKWDVCGGKWGKQGCPSYKHRTAPEMGLGQHYPTGAASQVEDG